MKRKEIVDHISHKHNITKQRSRNIFNQFFEILSNDLAKGEGFSLPGLGTFSRHLQDGKRVTIPWTRTTYRVPKKHVVHFHSSTVLDEEVKYKNL